MKHLGKFFVKLGLFAISTILTIIWAVVYTITASLLSIILMLICGVIAIWFIVELLLHE